MSRVAALMGIALAAACAPRTEVVVGLAADPQALAQIDVVELFVLDTAGRVQKAWSLPADAKLPASIGIVPAASSSENFEVVLQGGKLTGHDAAGNPVVAPRIVRRARIGFVEGRTLFLRLALVGPCLDELDGACPIGSWCVAGSCQPTTLSAAALPDYTAGAELAAQCGTSAAALGLTAPASVACPGSAACVDALCINGSAPVTTPLPDAATLDAGAPAADASSVDFALADGLADTSAASPDLAPDLAATSALDLAAIDLASPDLAIPDLAIAATPDLALAARPDLVLPPDLLPAPPNGFSWVSAAPTGDTITAIALDPSGATGSFAFAVTDHGDAIKVDGAGKMALESTGITVPLTSVYVHGTDVWAVGGGKLAGPAASCSYGGQCASGVCSASSCVAGNSGAGSFLLHRTSGGVWSTLSIPSVYGAATMVGIAGDGGSGVIAVGVRFDGSPIVVRSDGTTTRVVDVIQNRAAAGAPRSLYVDASGCGAFVGAGGTVRLLAAGQTLWTDPALAAVTGELTAVSGCGDDGSIIAGTVTTTMNALPVAYVRASGSWGATMLTSVSEGAFLSTLARLGSNDVWALSTNGSTLHWDGSTWSAPANQQYSGGSYGHHPVTLAAAIASGQPEVMLAARSELWRSTPLSAPLVPLGPTVPVTCDGAMAGFGGSLVAVSSHFTFAGTMPGTYYFGSSDSGSTWQPVPGGTMNSYFGALLALSNGSGGTTFYASDNNGVIRRAPDLTTGFTQTELNLANNISFSSLWGMGTQPLYAGGSTNNFAQAGSIYTKRSGSWALDVQTKTLFGGQTGVFGLYGFSVDDVWACGSQGPGVGWLAHRDMTGWKLVLPPSSTYGVLESIWGTSSSDLWVVGWGGALLHYDGTSFTQWPSPTDNNFFAVSGTASNDVWAAGSNSTVIHFDGQSWSAVDAHGSVENGDYFSGLYVDTKNVVVGGNVNVLRSVR